MKLFISHYLSLSGILKQGKFIFFSNLADKLTFFLIFLYIARSFSPNIFGFITAIFAFSNILHSFFEFGFTFYFQRESAGNNVQLTKEFNSAVAFKLITFILYLAAALVYFHNDLASNIFLIIIIPISIFVLGTASLFNSLLLGKGDYKLSFYSLLVSRLIILILLTIFYSFSASLNLIISAVFAGSVIQLLMLIYLLNRNKILNPSFNFNFNLVRKIFKSSLPIGAGMILIWVIDKLEILLLQNIMNLEAVAVYTIAYSIYKMSQLLANIILVPAYTNLSANFAANHYLKRKNIEEIFIIMISLALGVSVIIFFLADAVILLLYGDRYLASAQYLKIILIAVPGLFLNNLTGVILNSLRREKYPFIALTISAFVCILLNLTLINLIGIWGAVVTTIITEYLIFLIQFILLKRLLKKENLIRNE